MLVHYRKIIIFGLNLTRTRELRELCIGRGHMDPVIVLEQGRMRTHELRVDDDSYRTQTQTELGIET